MSVEGEQREKPIVIGLGTGRCGTTSLATLLNAQMNVFVTHEKDECRLKWAGANCVIDKTIAQFQQAQNSHPGKIIGDVHFAYLPYVAQLAAKLPNAIFLCLKRNRKATVESWLRKIGRRNPWLEHAGTLGAHSPWDDCFPKLGIPNPKIAANLYWEIYERVTNELQTTFPRQFHLIKTDALNSREGQNRILDLIFLETEDRILIPGICLNAGIQKETP